MKQNQEYFIKKLKNEQKNLIPIVISSFFLAFGINIISNFFYEYFNVESSLKLLFGFIVCALSFYFLFVLFFNECNKSLKISAFFVFNKEKNDIINVPDYSFCNNLRDYLKAASLESTGVKAIWEKISLNSIYTPEGDKHQQNFLQMKKLIEELTESIVLYDLSTNLTDYFNDDFFIEKNFRTFERKDLVDVWSKNRIIDLISRPLEERPHLNDSDFSSPQFTHICAAYNPDGSMFQEIELKLPKNSNVKKVNNILIVETDHLIIQFFIEFNGCNTNLPDGFAEYYLKLDNPDEYISVYQIDISVKIKIKPFALLITQQWEYIDWIDSFIESLMLYDENVFFDRINWNSVNVILYCLDQSSEKSNFTKEEKNSIDNTNINSDENRI